MLPESNVTINMLGDTFRINAANEVLGFREVMVFRRGTNIIQPLSPPKSN